MATQDSSAFSGEIGLEPASGRVPGVRATGADGQDDRGRDRRDADGRLTRQVLTAIAISVIATALALGLGIGAYFAFALLGLRSSGMPA